MPFELPKLNYSFGDLEPYIDARTMEIHYTKHHQTYITNLNNALSTFTELSSRDITALITSLPTLPQEIQTAVRNNGGGHFNHTLFWQLLTPENKQIPSNLTARLEKEFESIVKFQEEFKKASLARFGSGWCWLIEDNGKLSIVSTPNQDNPLMENKTVRILIGLDLWEHAYYLNYQNRRADYIDAFWKILDWEYVETKLA